MTSLSSNGIILLTINCLRSNNFQCLPNQQFLHKTNSSPTDGFHYLDLVMIRFSPASTQTNHRHRLIATSTESSDEASTHVGFERRTKVRWRWLKWHILEKNRKPLPPEKKIKTRFRLEATRARMAITCSETFRLDSDVSRPQGSTTMNVYFPKGNSTKFSTRQKVTDCRTAVHSKVTFRTVCSVSRRERKNRHGNSIWDMFSLSHINEARRCQNSQFGAVPPVGKWSICGIAPRVDPKKWW